MRFYKIYKVENHLRIKGSDNSEARSSVCSIMTLIERAYLLKLLGESVRASGAGFSGIQRFF